MKTFSPAVVVWVSHELSQGVQDFSDQGMGLPEPLLPNVQGLTETGLRQNKIPLLHSVHKNKFKKLLSKLTQKFRSNTLYIYYKNNETTKLDLKIENTKSIEAFIYRNYIGNDGKLIIIIQCNYQFQMTFYSNKSVLGVF